MSKYTDMLQKVMGIFATPEWMLEGIPTVPSNYSDSSGQKFIRVSLLSSQESLNLLSLRGMLQIEIYIGVDEGPMGIHQIADILDEYLLGVQLGNGQFTAQSQKSSLRLDGVDKANPSLFKGTYSVPFNYYGVQ